MKSLKINSVSVVSTNDIVESINENCSNKNKIELVLGLTKFGELYDMSFVELLLVELSKLCLKRIKKDKSLYNRNRRYFNALKEIVKYKEAV